MNEKSYKELCSFSTFRERFEYLKMVSTVGSETFGFDRIVNQKFYNSTEWRRIRDIVINRDNGYDLGVEGYPIQGQIIIHHMNPLCLEDIRNYTEYLVNPEFLICVSKETHNAIHYGGRVPSIYDEPVVRTAGDTRLW